VRSINSTPAVAIIIHKLKMFSVELLGKNWFGSICEVKCRKSNITYCRARFKVKVT